MLKEIARRYEATNEIAELEIREYELWLRYRELARFARHMAEHGGKREVKLARKRAVRAHVAHQKCAHEIVNMQKWRLFRDSRAHG